MCTHHVWMGCYQVMVVHQEKPFTVAPSSAHVLTCVAGPQEPGRTGILEVQHPPARCGGDVSRGKGHPPVARSLGPFTRRGPAWTQQLPVGKYCILPVPVAETIKKKKTTHGKN